MRLKGFLIVFFSLFYTYGSFAQSQGELTQSRILILLDESSSMIQKWPSGKEKYKAADELILRLMDSIYAINDQVEFSLRVFGHQYTVEEDNCFDTKNEVAFSKDNRTQMALRLDDIHPLGVTPIAYALMQAAKFDLVDEEHNAYSIILITDGGESCGGDICEVMKKLMKYKVYFKPYIVSLEDDASLKNTYACMGDFLQVTKDADMPRAVTTIVNAFRPVIKITKADYKQLQLMAANVPSALKVNIPIQNPDAPTNTPAKKESDNPPIPKPVKKSIDSAAHPVVDNTPKPPPPKKDTVAAPKPVSKIKVDEAPARPPAEKIARVATTRYNLLYTPTPTTKTLLPVPVHTVDITVKPEPENITGIRPAQLHLFNYSQPPARQMAFVTPLPMPAIDVPVTITPDKIAHIALSPKVTFAIAAPHTHKPTFIIPLPMPAIDVPVTITPESIIHTAAIKPHVIATTIPAATVPKARQAMSLPPLVIDIPAPPRNTDKIARLQTIRVQTRRNIFMVEERGILPRKLPALPPLKIDLPKTPIAKTPVTKPAIPVKDDAPFKKAEYTIEREDAKETTVEVYLTNGHGKFFATTPQMLLLEPGTNKVVKTFYRTVDANGNPDPIDNIPVGTYNLSLSARRILGVNNVKIEQNKKNKITVTVLPASLSFAYADAPERPVTEFVARVIERNKSQGRVQDQKCTAALEYDPGNYHIMINTFPQTDRNVDLDFMETVITIPQPGFVKFAPDDKIRVAVLYRQEGDKFQTFYTLDLNDPSAQHLRILPGQYQAHYHKGPGGPSVSEKVVTFLVKATETVTVPLN